MSNPTGVGGRNPPPAMGFQTSNTKSLTNLSPGPKFLTMKRINSTETLTKVSPFLIKKVIDATCGEVDMCKKTRSGELLVKTKTYTQAAKLIKLSTLSPNIDVEVCEHLVLNYTKGVIYCSDLRNISEEEIVQELKQQQVTEAKKILKRDNNNRDALIETGLVILTLSHLTLPETINIGYEKINIRPYIPLPMRCKNCHRFGHTSKFCKNIKLCPNCANNHHLNENNNEKCNLTTTCKNCHENNEPNPNHSTYDKKCPTFVKQKEIQAIKTLRKVDNKTAYSIYYQQHQQSSYSNTVRNHTNYSSLEDLSTTSPTQHTKNNNNPTNKNNSNNNNTKHKNYEPSTSKQQDSNNTNNPSLTPTSSNTKNILESTILSDTKIKIFPKNTPNHIKKLLKAKEKTSQNTKITKITNHTPDVNNEETPDTDYSANYLMEE